ncbi:MAG TPA: hypothetical protein VF767_11705 [Bryobacteraceae bacterium]
MRSLLKSWLLREEGQDLVEYTLLLAFVTITSAALLLYNADAVAAIWTATNTHLANANNAIH